MKVYSCYSEFVVLSPQIQQAVTQKPSGTNSRRCPDAKPVLITFQTLTGIHLNARVHRPSCWSLSVPKSLDPFQNSLSECCFPHITSFASVTKVVCLKVIQEHKILKSYKIVKIIPQILRGNRQCHRSGKEAQTVDICTEHGWRFSLSPLYKPYIERIPYRAFMYYNAI